MNKVLRENKSYILAVIRRFAKAFIGGGIASVLVILYQTPTVDVLKDTNTWIATLIIAFFTGGLLALEKALEGNTARKQ